MNKRVTAKDVAEAAGVSRTTVSFVLNNAQGMRISEETRQKVLEAAKTLNYHPDATARSMVKGKTFILGFVVRQEPDKAYADLLLPEVMRGISEVAGKSGYHLLFKPVPPEDNNNSTADRVSGEIKKMGGTAWITSGREIENYIPHEALTQRYPALSLKPLGQFDDIAEYLSTNVRSDEGKRFEKSKVDFAVSICPKLTRDNLSDTYDLRDRLDEVCKKIREWNRIGENGDVSARVDPPSQPSETPLRHGMSQD